MKQRQVEVYRFYKERYPDTLLFFHIGEQYVALFDDAKTIVKQNSHSNLEEIHYSDNDITFLSELAEDNRKIKIIEQRNSDGEFDYPDIDLIKYEEKIDFA